MSGLARAAPDAHLIQEPHPVPLLPPVTPGPTVGRAWITVDADEQSVAGDADLLEDHAPAQSPRTQADDEVDRPSGPFREEQHDGKVPLYVSQPRQHRL